MELKVEIENPSQMKLYHNDRLFASCLDSFVPVLHSFILLALFCFLLASVFLHFTCDIQNWCYTINKHFAATQSDTGLDLVADKSDAIITVKTFQNVSN